MKYLAIKDVSRILLTSPKVTHILGQCGSGGFSFCSIVQFSVWYAGHCELQTTIPACIRNGTNIQC